jgi:tyrosyl-tRNA synthetase
MEPQVAITMPILQGTDGVEKMSKSLDNYIGISESPRQIYGKTLSIPDNLIYEYFVLTTDASFAQLATIRKDLDGRSANPRDIKRKLARTLVTLYHGEDAALAAEEEFDRIFVKKDLPDDVPEYSINVANGKINIVRLLTETKLVTSNGEARRMVEQGGVTVDGERISDYNAEVEIPESVIVKVGKRRFLKVKRV